MGGAAPHTAGAVRIGRMARTLLDGVPVRAEIGLYGSFAETGRGHGTDRALVAGLLGMAPDDLDVPRSFEIAAERKLVFSFHTVQLRTAHPNTAVLDVTAEDGRRLVLRAASTGGGRIRVEQVNGVNVNFTGDFNTLIVRHHDIPGTLAAIARELSKFRVNVANMSLCRDRRGGDALMVLETDQRVSTVTREMVAEIPGVERVTYYERAAD